MVKPLTIKIDRDWLMSLLDGHEGTTPSSEDIDIVLKALHAHSDLLNDFVDDAIMKVLERYDI